MERLEDRLAIEDLINRYAWALDMRDFETLGTCFADECEFDSSPHELTPHLPFPARGREGIMSLVSGAQGKWASTQRRHVMTNLVVEFVDARQAFAKAYMTVFHTDPPDAPRAVLAGHYEDDVVFIENRWLFRKRTVYRDGPTAA